MYENRLPDDSEAPYANSTPAGRADPEQIARMAAEALAQGDWPVLLRHAIALQQASPDQPAGYRFVAIALQETASSDKAQAALDDLLGRFPIGYGTLRQQGWEALYKGNLPEAALLWRMGCAAFPDDPQMPLGLGLAWRAATRIEVSDLIFKNAVERFPDDQRLRIEQGWNAMYRQSWTEASLIWRAIRERDPDCHGAWHAGGLAARASGNLDEADRLFETGMSRFPDHPLLGREYAQLASQRQDWPEAARRWEMMRARFPDEREAYIAGGIALLRAGRYDYAERVLGVAVARYPDDSDAAFAHIQVAILRNAPGEALPRVEVALRHFPDRAELYALGAQAHLRLGQLAQGLALAEAGLNRFPDDPGIQREAARLARQRALAAEAAPATDPPPADSPDARLMLEFELLGQNCEFGLVQRHFGAEPLGLFRFTGISARQVEMALDDDLRGIGSPEFTVLHVEGNGEYMTRDTRYLMASHTFSYQGQAEPGRLLAGQCRKIAFLAGKFRDNLTDAPKIFVFRAAEPLPDAAMLSLHKALRRHCDAKLLWVRTVFGDAGEPAAGTVECRGTGLFIGHVSRLGQLEDGTANTDFGEWLALCRAVFAMVSGQPATQ